MSKKYEREEKEIDRLTKEVRELKRENKQLRQRLKTVSKGYYKYLADTEDVVEDEIVEINKEMMDKICWDCGGVYKKIIVHTRKWRQCQNASCGKKGKVSIVDE